ncbi:MAG: GTP-binding protein [Candidatus Sulfobium sp.]
MKLVQIAGYLGSGKTTLIIALAKMMAGPGLKTAVIVNDAGEVPVDGRVMEEFGLTVKDIGGGCICCQVAGNMIRTLESLAKGPRPDLIFVEPTGMAVPKTIRENVLPGAEKNGIVMGPTIVLLDATRAEKLLTYDTLKRLVSTQLRDADIIALSKADRVTPETLEKTHYAAAQINPAAAVLELSTHSGKGLFELAGAVRERVVAA